MEQRPLPIPFHQRRSIRLQEYDYSEVGAYFITICTHNRDCLFGTITDGEMRLNEYGRIVEQIWLEIPHHFPHVELDEFTIMPNHVHGIVLITNVGATHASPLHQIPKHKTSQPNGAKCNSLSAIVGSYKSAITNRSTKSAKRRACLSGYAIITNASFAMKPN